MPTEKPQFFVKRSSSLTFPQDKYVVAGESWPASAFTLTFGDAADHVPKLVRDRFPGYFGPEALLCKTSKPTNDVGEELDENGAVIVPPPIMLDEEPAPAPSAEEE